MQRNRQALQQSGRPAHAGLPEWTLRLTSTGGPFLDVEVDRASISAELAGLEELMRRLEKHRESDIMVSDPAHRFDAVNLVLWDPNISIVTHWPYPGVHLRYRDVAVSP